MKNNQFKIMPNNELNNEKVTVDKEKKNEKNGKYPLNRIKKYLPDVFIIGSIFFCLIQKFRAPIYYKCSAGEPIHDCTLSILRAKAESIGPIGYDYSLEKIVPIILILIGIDIVIRRYVSYKKSQSNKSSQNNKQF